MKKNLRIIGLVLLDAICINVAYVFGLLLRFELILDGQFDAFWAHYKQAWLIVTILELGIFALMGLYRSLWKYASTEELIKVFVACIIATIAGTLYLIISRNTLPRSVYIIAGLFTVFFVGATRFSYRTIRNCLYPGYFNLKTVDDQEETRLLLVGAGDAGATLIKEVKMHSDNNQKVVVAVDDNPDKKNQRILGVKIAGNRYDIPDLVGKYAVDEIIISIPTASRQQISEIVDICHKTKCKVKILPGMIDLVDGRVSVSALRDVDIEDLLGREPIEVNLKEISGYLENRVVMVTGGGGSIGSELCRQIAKYSPRRLVIVDIYENSSYEIQLELRRKYPELYLDVAIGSIADKDRITEIFDKYHPHVVFHAAAHKHVPLMEDSPGEAVVNNVIGTNNCMDLAEQFKADKFILISTDKAVNPTSVMGATKRICEMLMQYHAQHSNHTDFAAVRFGNVLGSNGSVIPLFRAQIANGGPVTVTHKDITRYFMTIPEAVQLVIQAGAMATGGEIFILDMGEPVKIMDLAENLIRLSGFEPYEDIDIQVTGLRPGEKLYEELLLSEEGIKETSHNKIFIGHPIPASEGFSDMIDEGVDKNIEKLKGKSDSDVRNWIKNIVPNYQNG